MKKFTFHEQLCIEVLKAKAKGSKKYDLVVNIPGRADAKRILKDLGFRGKYLN